MNKSTMKKLITIIFSIIIGVMISMVILSKKTNLDSYDNCVVRYVNEEKSISEKLSEEDFLIIKKILNNNRLYRDNPSCGFDKKISLQFQNKDKSLIFSIAQDNCPIFKDEGTGKYFSISEPEREIINNIFKKYGVKFPSI